MNQTLKIITLTIVLLLSTRSLYARQPVVAVLGDSYSTFAGHIPEGNEAWYNNTTDPDRTDVGNVGDTWWSLLCKEGGYTLGTNDSYSGATICYTGYNGENFKPRSFITRLPRLGQPDIILIFGGTNDSWAGSPIGDYKYEGQTEKDLYSFRPAMARLLSDAKRIYPEAKIYFIVNSELRKEISDSAVEICDHYGIPCIRLCYIDKIAGHPSKEGMRKIKDQVLNAIRK